MSQSPTPEALAAADSWLTSTETYLSINPGMDMRTYLALAFDAERTDLQATIARLTSELAEARDAEAAEIVAWLRETDWGEDDDDLYGALADAIALHEHRKD